MAKVLDASSSEEIENNNNAEKEMVVIEGSGGGNTTTKKRRNAGEVSGRQTALKRFKKEKGFLWDCQMPPPFHQTVITMREAFIDFLEDNTEEEAASAMRIYSQQEKLQGNYKNYKNGKFLFKLYAYFLP